MTEIVTHSPDPLPAPWRFERDLVIGVEYGDDAYMLRNPGSFAILENGYHVLLDASPSQIRIYDREGRHVCDFGQPGDGPTDLPRSPYWCYLTSGGRDRFYIWNRYGTNRLQQWHVSGDLLNVWTLDQHHPLYRPAIIDAWDGIHFFGCQLSQRTPDRCNPQYLIRTDAEGTRVDTLFFLDYHQIPITCSMIEAELGVSLFSDPLITSDGRVCVGAAYEDWVRVIDQESGRETIRFSWDHTADAISDTIINQYRGQMVGGNDMEAGARWLHENLSIVQLIEGINGEIWIQRRPMAESDGTWTVDVFSKEGEYRGRIQVPNWPRRMKPFGQFMYGIGRNGEAPALIRYRLIDTGSD